MEDKVSKYLKKYILIYFILFLLLIYYGEFVHPTLFHSWFKGMMTLMFYSLDIFYVISAILLLKRYHKQVLVSVICLIVLLYNIYFTIRIIIVMSSV